MLISETQQQINLGIFLFGSAASLGFFSKWIFDRSKWGYWKHFFLIGIPASVLLFLSVPILSPYLDFLQDRLLESMAGRGVIALAIIMVGTVAHVFKKKNQLRYGQLEVFFGFSSAWSVATGMTPGRALFSHWVALAGAAYVVARGLNNWSDALQRDPNKYGAATIYGHFLNWFIVREPNPNLSRDE